MQWKIQIRIPPTKLWFDCLWFTGQKVLSHKGTATLHGHHSICFSFFQSFLLFNWRSSLSAEIVHVGWTKMIQTLRHEDHAGILYHWQWRGIPTARGLSLLRCLGKNFGADHMSYVWYVGRPIHIISYQFIISHHITTTCNLYLYSTYYNYCMYNYMHMVL